MEPVAEPEQPDQHSPMSLPGEPQFTVATADVGSGVQMVLLQIASTNGVIVQLVVRPDLALTVAKLLSDKAKLARSGIIVPSNNGVPPDLKGPGLP